MTKVHFSHNCMLEIRAAIVDSGRQVCLVYGGTWLHTVHIQQACRIATLLSSASTVLAKGCVVSSSTVTVDSLRTLEVGGDQIVNHVREPWTGWTVTFQIVT